MNFSVPYANLANEALGLQGSLAAAFERVLASGRYLLGPELAAFEASCLDELQAALLRVQLPYLNKWTESRRLVALRYNEMLAPFGDVPAEGPGEYCVYQTYVFKSECRNELQQHLRRHGVEALVHYATPIQDQPAAAFLNYSRRDLPASRRHVEHIISLPLYPGLARAQQDEVVACIAEFSRRCVNSQSSLPGRIP